MGKSPDSGWLLEQGRASFSREAWREAYEHLTAADRLAPLSADDLNILAITADLTGKDLECVDLWMRAQNLYVGTGKVREAARCAFWLAMVTLLVEGEPSKSSGWVSRGQRLLEDEPLGGLDNGYLLVPAGARALFFEGDATTAGEMFAEAAEIGRRSSEPDLTWLANLGLGQSELRLGDIAEGLRRLDEVMAVVQSGGLSPLAMGIIYCGVLLSCQEIFDLRRAQAWTDTFSRWCQLHTDLVQFRGQCVVHRAEILRLRGGWADALAEIQQTCENVSLPGSRPWAGAAFYEEAELYRLGGRFKEAEEAYRKASNWGKSPQPGLALLRMAQRRPDAAVAALTRELQEAQDPATRSRLLSAHVEVMLSIGNLDSARASSDELAAISSPLQAPLIEAMSLQARGSLTLAEGKAEASLSFLRRSWQTWYDFEAPYEAARVRVLIAAACRTLGDTDTAEMELDAARQAFQKLGAGPDLDHVVALWAQKSAGHAAGLTGREIEVLRLVSAGKTNHDIATDLFLSDHTVRRHLQNIFAKLGVSSRSAATAFAFKHNLV